MTRNQTPDQLEERKASNEIFKIQFSKNLIGRDNKASKVSNLNDL